MDTKNILLDKYIEFYVKICTNTVKKSSRQIDRLLSNCLNHRRLVKASLENALFFFKKCLLFLSV